MKWLLEEDIFEENLEELQKEIVKQGGTYELTKYKPFDDNEHILDIYDQADKDVFFYGTLNLCRIVQDITDWTTYCNFDQYECNYYYPRLGDYLINRDFVVLPFGNLNDNIFELFSSDILFTRPNSGEKSFSGMPLGRNSMFSQINQMSQGTKREDLVLISSYKNVGKEWRLLISDYKVLTGSQYKDTGEFVTGEVPLSVISYANSLLELVGYHPDPIWTLDICEYKGDLYIMEVGGSSCAGWYDSDLSKIVSEVHKKVDNDNNRG